MDYSAKQLVDIFEYLPAPQQKTLVEFAEFLKSRAPAPKTLISEPVNIPRPETESVIAAIKRLTATYPMIDRSAMFNETSDLMMQHTMSGRKAMDVIDELQVVFDRKFKKISESIE
jgi:hypothetical protein